jgi:hypothetical protein
MFTFKFSDLASLHQAFNKTRIHNTLIEYFAEPKTPHNNFNYDLALQGLQTRQPLDTTIINMAPQDVNIFKKRFAFLSNNNEAYRIAMTANPTIKDLINFSYLSAGWSTLFPIKVALVHHRTDWHMKDYTGLLPFGAAVITFYNSLGLYKTISKSPDFADHVNLQNLSNELAPALGITSMDLNNYMYLEGMEILKQTATSQAISQVSIIQS